MAHTCVVNYNLLHVLVMVLLTVPKASRIPSLIFMWGREWSGSGCSQSARAEHIPHLMNDVNKSDLKTSCKSINIILFPPHTHTHTHFTHFFRWDNTVGNITSFLVAALPCKFIRLSSCNSTHLHWTECPHVAYTYLSCLFHLVDHFHNKINTSSRVTILVKIV